MKAESTLLSRHNEGPDCETASFRRIRLEDPPCENPRSKKVLEVKKEVARQERNKVREQE